MTYVEKTINFTTCIQEHERLRIFSDDKSQVGKHSNNYCDNENLTGKLKILIQNNTRKRKLQEYMEIIR